MKPCALRDAFTRQLRPVRRCIHFCAANGARRAARSRDFADSRWSSWPFGCADINRGPSCDEQGCRQAANSRSFVRALLKLGLVALWPAIAQGQIARPDLPTTAQIEFFELHVRPVLADRCYKCHGPKQQQNGLRLDSRTAMLAGGDSGPAIVPGHPNESLLIEAVRHESFEMPPDEPLPADAIDYLVQWIDDGVPGPRMHVRRRRRPRLRRNHKTFGPSARSKIRPCPRWRTTAGAAMRSIALSFDSCNSTDFNRHRKPHAER